MRVMSGCCSIRIWVPVTFHGIKDQQLGNQNSCVHAHGLLLYLFLTFGPSKIMSTRARSNSGTSDR